MDGLKKYGKLILGFAISTVVVFGSMNMWLLTITSPIFVFLIFKLLGIWRTKERGIYGTLAIVIGVMLFFLAFSYHVDNIPQGNFENKEMKAIIEPYSTSNMSKIFNITVTYKGITNDTLSYTVVDINSNKVIERSQVNGTIKLNTTEYNFHLNVDRGIYNVTMQVNNSKLSIAAIKENALALFERYMKGPGVYMIFLLVALYILFIIGVHMIRRGQKVRMRYMNKK